MQLCPPEIARQGEISTAALPALSLRTPPARYPYRHPVHRRPRQGGGGERRAWPTRSWCPRVQDCAGISTAALRGEDGDSAKPCRRCARQDPPHPCRAGVHPDMAGGLIATRLPHPPAALERHGPDRASLLHGKDCRCSYPQHQSGIAWIVPEHACRTRAPAGSDWARPRLRSRPGRLAGRAPHPPARARGRLCGSNNRPAVRALRRLLPAPNMPNTHARHPSRGQAAGGQAAGGRAGRAACPRRAGSQMEAEQVL